MLLGRVGRPNFDVPARAIAAHSGASNCGVQVEAGLGPWLVKVNEGLASREPLQFIVVTAEPWTMANGCLTPAMKIKRSRIEAGDAAVVAGWYQAPGPVVWA